MHMNMWEALPWILITCFGGGGFLALCIGHANKVVEEAKAKRGGLPADPLKRAFSILEQRYARGEIDRDQFLEQRGYLQLSAESRAELTR
jgi:hypothetical protein